MKTLLQTRLYNSLNEEDRKSYDMAKNQLSQMHQDFIQKYHSLTEAGDKEGLKQLVRNYKEAILPYQTVIAKLEKPMK